MPLHNPIAVSEGYASAPESPGGYESAASALSDHRAASLRVRPLGCGWSVLIFKAACL